MKKKIFIATTILGSLGLIYGYYEYNRPVQSLASATPDFEIIAKNLIDDFVTDEAKANEMYLGKIIQVEGNILAIETGETTVVVLEGIDFNTIRAALSKDISADERLVGQVVKIKGSCSGFLMDVILNECVLVN